MKNLNLNETTKINGGICECYTIAASLMQQLFVVNTRVVGSTTMVDVELTDKMMNVMKKGEIAAQDEVVERNMGITDINTCKAFCCSNSHEYFIIAYASNADNIRRDCPGI